MLLGHFWAYVGQPHGHIGWATSMPFASINSTYPRTNPKKIHKKILRIGDFEKRYFDFFFSKFFLFSFFPWKQVKVYWLAKMGQNFDQARLDNTFWPMPNILKGSVCSYYLESRWIMLMPGGSNISFIIGKKFNIWI